jgi:hypothetical protein
MPELVYSGLPAEQEQRLVRIYNDFCILRASLTRGQIKTQYQALERMRDELSRMLDKADGKDA